MNNSFTNPMYNHLNVQKKWPMLNWIVSDIEQYSKLELWENKWALACLECYLQSIHLQIIGLIYVWTGFGIKYPIKVDMP